MDPRRIICIVCISTLVSCASPAYRTFTDWDSNENRLLDSVEFVNAYEQGSYFVKWSETLAPVGYEAVYQTIFENIDNDSSRSIDHHEFYRGVADLYFPVSVQTFSVWDENQDAGIDRGEFLRHSSEAGFATLTDVNENQRISEREMATQMFFVSDVNQDREVDKAEFDLWTWFR